MVSKPNPLGHDLTACAEPTGPTAPMSEPLHDQGSQANLSPLHHQRQRQWTPTHLPSLWNAHGPPPHPLTPLREPHYPSDGCTAIVPTHRVAPHTQHKSVAHIPDSPLARTARTVCI